MPQVLAKFKKNRGIEIWVTFGEFQGEERIDIREYFRPDNGPDYHPTRKGVAIPKKHIVELLDLIESVIDDDSPGTTKVLELSKSVQIWAGNREYLNHPYKELRKYVFSKEKGDWNHTHQGITFKSEIARELYKTIEGFLDVIGQ